MPDAEMVYIVDDDPEVRRSLRWLIESVPLQVAACPDARTFLEQYDPARTSCLVLDVRMPGMTGLELQERLVGSGIEIPVIMVTGYADVPSAIRAMKAGAIDFIEKPYRDEVLLEQIQIALRRDGERRASIGERAEYRARVESLTPREHEVLDLLVQGRTTRAIASELGISPKTVDIHRAHLKKKLHAGSVADVVRVALMANGI